MKTATNKTFILLLLLVTAFTSCKEGNSIYDPGFEEEAQPNPVITNITPEGGYLAGVDEITIHGENFSTEENGNQVFFDGQPGIVHSYSPNELVVRPAQVIDDSVEVIVSSRGALNFSNTVTYQLDQAIFPIPGYNEFNNSTGITKNAAGDIIFSLQDETGGAEGIKIWNDSLGVQDYLTSSFSWNALKVGPDGLVYGVRNLRALFREDEGSLDNTFAIGNTGEAYRNLDFDSNGYIWIVGDNANIIRVDITDGTLERFSFSANLRAVRYFDGKLYVGGQFNEDGMVSEQIWSFDIVNDEAVNEQQVFTITGDLQDNNTQILEITFDEDGLLYFGSNTGSGIYTWSEEDGIEEFYPGLINPSGLSFTWVDNYLVASIMNLGESTHHPTKIDVMKEGAPYMGTSN